MTPEELYAIWAPPESFWSPWVIPVPFAQLSYVGEARPKELPPYNVEWASQKSDASVAIIVDLPGAQAIHYGMALLGARFRPVPIIDGSPGPDVGGVVLSRPVHSSEEKISTPASVVDMRGLLAALCEGAHSLTAAQLAPNAPPAFLLDSHRMTTVRVHDADERVYDNRWMVFPQDFPSGKLLRNRGITRVVLVREGSPSQPPDDLAHVLLRWQEEGIAIESKGLRHGEPVVSLHVAKPFRYRRAWYRALAVLGLRRNDAGGFGGYPPDPSGAG